MLRDALSLHFEKSGLPADGDYLDPWVRFRIGPIPLALPNFAAGRRVVRYHHAHHVLTGYATDSRRDGDQRLGDRQRLCTPLGGLDDQHRRARRRCVHLPASHLPRVAPRSSARRFTPG